jgi:hypothetical protein
VSLRLYIYFQPIVQYRIRLLTNPASSMTKALCPGSVRHALSDRGVLCSNSMCLTTYGGCAPCNTCDAVNPSCSLYSGVVGSSTQAITPSPTITTPVPTMTFLSVKLHNQALETEHKSPAVVHDTGPEGALSSRLGVLRPENTSEASIVAPKMTQSVVPSTDRIGLLNMDQT